MNGYDMSAAVSRGAALLDRTHPGWAGQVDLAFLDLADCVACVLGQLFGAYADGCDEMNLNMGSELIEGDDETAPWLGFELPDGLMPYALRPDGYEDMRIFWLREIRRRR